MNKRSILFSSLMLAAAMILTFFKVPLASSQGLTLTAAQVSEQLPTTDLEAAPPSALDRHFRRRDHEEHVDEVPEPGQQSA